MARIVALTALLVLVAPAAAAANPDRAAATDAMETYFAGEKLGGWVLIGLGAAGLASGGALLASESETLEGMSYPLLGFGLLHAAAGVFVYISSNKRIDDFDDQIETDPSTFAAAESKRIDSVHTQFRILKAVEIVLIGGGLTMAVVGERTDRRRLSGFGLGLAIEAAATLAFDVWAARRAHRYDARLSTLTVSAHLPGNGGAPLPTLAFTTRF